MSLFARRVSSRASASLQSRGRLALSPGCLASCWRSKTRAQKLKLTSAPCLRYNLPFASGATITQTNERAGKLSSAPDGCGFMAARSSGLFAHLRAGLFARHDLGIALGAARRFRARARQITAHKSVFVRIASSSLFALSLAGSLARARLDLSPWKRSSGHRAITSRAQLEHTASPVRECVCVCVTIVRAGQSESSPKQLATDAGSVERET